MKFPANNKQISSIAEEINKLEHFELEYNYKLYPNDQYKRFKNTFSSLEKKNDQIYDALRWKWGHWNKTNFPESHKSLINRVESYWNSFVVSQETNDASKTFDWWKDKLGKNTRYITTAYITHLVHHEKGIVIIDQHNFRCMNFFLKKELPQWKYNKKPSKWSDLALLSDFSEKICQELKWDKSKLDRVLMIYGRDKIPRN